MAAETDSVDVIQRRYVENITRIALFAALATAGTGTTGTRKPPSAPVTLQVLGVFLAGILLGPLWGAGALVLYLLAGAIGAPVFAQGAAGIGVLLGPTGGYLLSYPVATAVVGAIVHRGLDLRDPREVGLPTLVGAMAAGTGIIYALGIVGLIGGLDLGLAEAFITGAVVFLPAEALKIAAAVGIVRSEELAIST